VCQHNNLRLIIILMMMVMGTGDQNAAWCGMATVSSELKSSDLEQVEIWQWQ